MTRKPELKPGAAARSELTERRLAELEARVRSMQGRQATPGTSATSTVINQAAHGLTVNNVVRHNGTAWVKSQADTTANAVVGGIVIAMYLPIFKLAGAI